MLLKVCNIAGCEFRALDDKQVFRVTLFARFCEVEGTSDHGVAVDDDDFVVRDGVLAVDPRWDIRVFQEGGLGVVCGFVGFIENRLYAHAATESLHQSARDRCRSKGIRLDEDELLCVADFLDDGLGASAFGREINAHLVGADGQRRGVRRFAGAGLCVAGRGAVDAEQSAQQEDEGVSHLAEWVLEGWLLAEQVKGTARRRKS